jgi:ABC-2 type transport system ATP-binding protein
MPAVELVNISKAYGTTPAVRDVSLTVEPGELFGLIGPDGAGKTTLFRVLATLLLADAGTATVAGHDVVRDFRAIRNVVGYMPGRFSLYQDLTVQENLEFFAAVFRTTVRDNYELVRDIYEQLAPFKDRRAGALSGGMKQKLALCCALIHKPEVLLLDEPTTGVDAVSRQEFWHMLGTLKARGITIVVSTPYMDEAARCERVALLQTGQVLRVETPAALRAAYPWPLYAVRAARMHPLLQDLRAYPAAHSCYAFGESAHLSLADPDADAAAHLTAYLTSKGHREVTVMPVPATIEDTFMDLLARTSPSPHSGHEHTPQ